MATYQYQSIYSRAAIISKKDMCELLNLDTSRDNLEFSPAEIKKAYQIRAHRFHPDRQEQAQHPIPREVCRLLMQDIAKAKHHLLVGKDRVLGLGAEEIFESFRYINQDIEDESELDWFACLIELIEQFEAGLSDTSESLYYASRFSHSISIWIFLSCFSDGRLLLHAFNPFAEELAYINQFFTILKEHHFDTLLLNFSSLFSQTYLEQEILTEPEVQEIINQFLSELSVELSPEQIQQLSQRLHALYFGLRETLSEEAKEQLINIIMFWVSKLSVLPSWWDILGVYFISLGFTAYSIPLFFQAVIDIFSTILVYKGVLQLLISSLLIVPMTLVMFPIYLLVLMTSRLAAPTVVALFQLTSALLNLAISAVNFVAVICTGSFGAIYNGLVGILESVTNVVVRVPLVLMLDLVNSILVIVVGQYLLSATSIYVLELFNNLFNYLRVGEPISEVEVSNELDMVQRGTFQYASYSEAASYNSDTFTFPTFFETRPLHNDQDTFLEQVFESVSQTEIPIGAHTSQ